MESAKIPLVLLSVLLFVPTSQPGAIEMAPSKCVEALYRRGGIGLLVARRICETYSNDEALKCQNSLFLEAGFDPMEALNFCRANPSARFAECVVNRVRDNGEWQSPAAKFCQQENLSRYSEHRFPEANYSPQSLRMPNPDRPTICSLTINSSDEIETFREVMGMTDYDYIELVPDWKQPGSFLPRDDQWLGQTCAKVPRCDILVASGHFAGIFLGEAGFELSLNKMQELACSESCPSVFERTQEVFLFGCNTLADKSPDQRSFAEYRDILVMDGLSQADAEIAAARRYLPYGRSFLDNMRALFPNATSIHGFPSVSPAGPNIRQALRQHLLKRVRPANLGMRTTSGSPALAHRLCSIRGHKGHKAFVQQITESLQRGEIGLDAFDLVDSSLRLTSEDRQAVRSQIGHRLDDILAKVKKLGAQHQLVVALRLLQGLGRVGLIEPTESRSRQRAVLLEAIRIQPNGSELRKVVCDASYLAPLASLIEISEFPRSLSSEEKQTIGACLRAWH